MCRLLHLKIISLKKPLQIGLCNKASPLWERVLSHIVLDKLTLNIRIKETGYYLSSLSIFEKAVTFSKVALIPLLKKVSTNAEPIIIKSTLLAKALT